MKRVAKRPLKKVSFWNLKSQFTSIAQNSVYQLRLKVVIFVDQEPIVSNPNIDIFHAVVSFVAFN